MQLKIANSFVTAIVFALSLLMTSQVTAQQKTKYVKKQIPAKQRAEIETIVREYLLKNPSIIREVTAALAAQEEKEKQARLTANLKAHQAEIYADPDTPILGNPKGDVTITVFFDYNCGYCKKTLPALQSLIAKDASLKVLYKEFPVLGIPSQLGARAAMAAHRQGKYAAFHEALIQSEDVTIDEIKNIAERLQLDFTTMVKDMDDPKLVESIQRNARLANALEINGTPAYIVGGQIIPGAIDANSLANIVTAERAKHANNESGKTLSSQAKR